MRKLADERTRAALLVNIVMSISLPLMDRFCRFIRATLHQPRIAG